MSWEESFAEDMDARAKKRTVTVGWTVRAPHAHVIWGAPRTFEHNLPKPTSAKSVQACPAAIDFDRRHFVIPCPIDVTLRFERKANGQLSLVDADGVQSAMRPQGAHELMTLQPQNEWRHPERPIIQFNAPYVFVSDDPCYVVQTPPYLDYFSPPRPGVQICGRFPIHIWPRPFSWAFEWCDPTQPLVLKRGEPWFYVHFETENPAARVRLVEVELTPELEEHIKAIADVTNFVNRTFSLFAEAQRRRPANLLKPKKA